MYEPICSSDALTPALRDELMAHQNAWTLYLSQQWQQALAAFTKLKELSPERKIYALMCERILTLQAHPPGEKWDGSYTHTSK